MYPRPTWLLERTVCKQIIKNVFDSTPHYQFYSYHTEKSKVGPFNRMIECTAVECIESNKIVYYATTIDGVGGMIQMHVPDNVVDALSYSLIQTRKLYDSWSFKEIDTQITSNDYFLSPSFVDIAQLTKIILDNTSLCKNCSKLVANYVLGEVVGL